MSGKERRNKIIEILKESKRPISGKELAQTFGISRQAIVQDIAILRAESKEITSTNTGYILPENKGENDSCSRVFKVTHTTEETQEELELIVAYGGIIKDVFVFHKIYGTVKADLNIRTKEDILNFMEEIKGGKSSLLMNVTSGYHYHTVEAPTDTLLDLIQDQLAKKGFLAELQDFEPVDFWHEQVK